MKPWSVPEYFTIRPLPDGHAQHGELSTLGRSSRQADLQTESAPELQRSFSSVSIKFKPAP